MTTVTLAAGWRVCPECGETYQRLSRHWSAGSCAPPPLSDHQHAVVTGLLLGSASIQGNGHQQHLLASTPHLEHAVWIAEHLGWLTHSLKRDDYDEGHRYLVRTHAHQRLARYRAEWYGEDGRKRIPGGLDLSPTEGRVWWADAGGLQWHGPHDSQRTGTWSAEADAKADRIQGVLSDVGFDATRAGKRVQLQGAQLEDWLEYVEESVPGVAYKWAGSREDYQNTRADSRVDRLRSGTWGDGDVRLSLYPPAGGPVPVRSVGDLDVARRGPPSAWARMDWRAHIQAAARVHGEPLTMLEYRTYRQTYGGPVLSALHSDGSGPYPSWEAACADAGVQHGSQTGPEAGRALTPRPLQEIVEAVARVWADVDDDLSLREYRSKRDKSDPAVNTIYRHLEPDDVPGWSGWDVAVMLASRLVEGE